MFDSDLTYVDRKYFNFSSLLKVKLLKFIDRPTYRLPYKFRKKYLERLEDTILYKQERYTFDQYWRSQVFWFKETKP